MVGFVIWIVGLVLTIRAALEIWRIHAPAERKLIAIVLVVFTSWVGLLFYYFYGKPRMAQWLGQVSKGIDGCITVYINCTVISRYKETHRSLTVIGAFLAFTNIFRFFRSRKYRCVHLSYLVADGRLFVLRSC